MYNSSLTSRVNQFQSFTRL